jgi:tryptophan synthase alpha chain
VSSRISKKFKGIIREGKKAFIPYVMAGYPSIKRSAEVVRILEDCGSDIIELGVPFSDPLADGPTIQKAAQSALDKGITLSSVIDFVSTLRSSTQIPIVLMTYYNPVFRYGEEKFVRDASSAGVDGIIVPDLPPDESAGLIQISRKCGFDTVFLVAPTSTEKRIKKVVQAARGFIYYVSMTGITGARLSMESTVGSHIKMIRTLTNKPIAVGFGISTPDEAAVVSNLADGVIVGSAIVKRLSDPDDDLRRYLLSLRKSIK